MCFNQDLLLVLFKFKKDNVFMFSTPKTLSAASAKFYDIPFLSQSYKASGEAVNLKLESDHKYGVLGLETVISEKIHC